MLKMGIRGVYMKSGSRELFGPLRDSTILMDKCEKKVGKI